MLPRVSIDFSQKSPQLMGLRRPLKSPPHGEIYESYAEIERGRKMGILSIILLCHSLKFFILN